MVAKNLSWKLGWISDSPVRSRGYLRKRISANQSGHPSISQIQRPRHFIRERRESGCSLRGRDSRRRLGVEHPQRGVSHCTGGGATSLPLLEEAENSEPQGLLRR